MTRGLRRFPDVRITVFHPEWEDARDVVLSDPLGPRMNALLWSLHDKYGGRKIVECRMHDDDPKLADHRSQDGRVHGIWLTLCGIRDLEARQAGDVGAMRLILRHWPRSGFSSHSVPRPMTEDHIKGQEYMAERGQDFGHGVVCNRAFSSTNRCRADVRISGSAAVMAAEIQVSDIETPSVLKRTGKAADAGATSIWFPMMESLPLWHAKVSCVSTNQIVGLEPRSWTVTTGPRLLEDERCAPGSRHQPCPVRGKGWCGRIHPLWAPMSVVLEKKVTVDDIVEQFPDGGLVQLDTGTGQGVIVTTPADREKWLDYRSGIEGQKTKTKTPPQPRETQQLLRHPEYSVDLLRERLGREPGGAPSAFVPTLPPGAAPVRESARCNRCSSECPAWMISRHGLCGFCEEQVKLSYLVQNRLCLECHGPLPSAAIHLAYHRQCQPVCQLCDRPVGRRDGLCGSCWFDVDAARRGGSGAA